MKKYLLFSLFLLAFTCDDTIKFNQPQPLNKNDLEAIPKILWGMYIEIGDSGILMINEKQIIEKSFFEITATVQEIDSAEECYLKGDTLICYIPDIRIPVKIINDSVFGLFPNLDTIFTISETQKLRKSGKYYFQNFKIDENTWKVKLMDANSKEGLVISTLQKKDTVEVKKFTEVIRISNDQDSTVQYKIDPVNKELMKIIKAGLLRKQSFYKKISE